MIEKKTGVLLVNLGSPDSPKLWSVGKYLFEFLNDKRVIDLLLPLRWFLVNFIIIPFRVRNSSKIYHELWTEKGSPLILHTESLAEKLGKGLPSSHDVFWAMRYNKPSLRSVLEKMREKNFSKIIVIPLYPQYASSTTGSTVEEVLKIISKWYVIPELEIKGQFFDHPKFIDSIIENAKSFDLKSYDHIIFSYHGLPTRQLDKVYPNKKCDGHFCNEKLTHENQFCYEATCYATTRLLVEKLSLKEGDYTVAFQSRLDNGWIKPYSDDVVEELAKKGVKKLLFFSPAFTADCLETTVEIGSEYKELFLGLGGEKLDLVPSLNSEDTWVECLKSLVS